MRICATATSSPLDRFAGHRRATVLATGLDGRTLEGVTTLVSEPASRFRIGCAVTIVAGMALLSGSQT